MDSDDELIYKFDWNDIKAKTNLAKHKISFDEGKTIFKDPFLITYSDDLHSDKENRLIKYRYVYKRTLVIGRTYRKTGNYKFRPNSYYQLQKSNTIRKKII